jgi:hypothetical protein
MKHILSITLVIIVLSVKVDAHKVNYEKLAKSIKQMKNIVNLQKNEPEKAKIEWIQFMFERKKNKGVKSKQISENKKNIKFLFKHKPRHINLHTKVSENGTFVIRSLDLEKIENHAHQMKEANKVLDLIQKAIWIRV